MNGLLTQIILAARNRGIEGWMNILFIVALAAFYVVGSIIKAKAKKPGEKDQGQLTRKPRPFGGARGPETGRPVAPAAVGQARPVKPPRRKIVRPQPAVRKTAAIMDEAIELGTLEPSEVMKLPSSVPLAETKELVGKPLRKLADRDAGPAAEIAGGKYLPEIISDYADPDELRMAILHYEILGKPLSLRDRSEHTY
jgi:hypothetical protein